tara:strand:+ start:346 stop:543 length:198 start_codon:yes stop_codon:yes gene_type:complete
MKKASCPDDFKCQPTDIKFKKTIEDDKKVKEKDVFGKQSKPDKKTKKKSKPKPKPKAKVVDNSSY